MTVDLFIGLARNAKGAFWVSAWLCSSRDEMVGRMLRISKKQDVFKTDAANFFSAWTLGELLNYDAAEEKK